MPPNAYMRGMPKTKKNWKHNIKITAVVIDKVNFKKWTNFHKCEQDKKLTYSLLYFRSVLGKKYINIYLLFYLCDVFK